MSELLDKQVYVQIEILKIIIIPEFTQAHESPREKCAMRARTKVKEKTNFFVVEEGCIRRIVWGIL